MPMIRLAMELPLIEDIGIKIMHKLNKKKRTKKIKDIIPTRNIKIEDALSLMVKMRLCGRDETDVLRRIYEWVARAYIRVRLYRLPQYGIRIFL